MAKLSTDHYFKARIDNLLIYPMRGMMIMRTASGFTTEALLTESRYELSRKNANEFGKLSSSCKQIRIALADILPKQNNLAVVNSFTKKMREILEHDKIYARGERQLANALATEAGRQYLTGYEFNPNTTFTLDYSLSDDLLRVTPAAIKFPKGINHLGFRVHQLAFDFATGESTLVSGDWVFGTNTVDLVLPTLPNAEGIIFTILEVKTGADDLQSVKIVRVE